MNVSGTLHFYSGERREFFFVFDDDIAQQLYEKPEFSIEDVDSRRVYISVGSERFIHLRTLSFSQKQTEIKVSLCSQGSKENLGALTTLYDWFADRGRPHPQPFDVLGTLKQVQHQGERVWELRITEPADLVVPPGLSRRKKEPPAERRSYTHRRQFVERDLSEIGRSAEKVALDLACADFPVPDFACLWRKEYLDSEREEIRRMGIIADIDVWSIARNAVELFIEVKAQKVRTKKAEPVFHLSLGEWRSHASASRRGIPYQVWLFQYRELRDFTQALTLVELVVFENVDRDWLQPDSYLVTPGPTSGTRYSLA